MSWVVGIDGCKGGWIAAGQQAQGDEVRFEFLGSLEDLEAKFPGFRLAAIDMPIGLPDKSYRLCDLEAKEAVGKRRNSIFMTPPRRVIWDVVHKGLPDLEAKHDHAKLLCAELGRPMPSRQAVAIFSKIVEVDKLLSDQAMSSRVIEVHPEFSFRLMKGSDLAYSKKRPRKAPKVQGDWLGKLERLDLLGKTDLKGAYEKGIGQFKGGGHVADDDLHDCLAALWSAWRKIDGTALELPVDQMKLQEAKTGDGRGRPMVITG